MLVEKKKRSKSDHLGRIRNKQMVAISASPKKVTLPKFSWEKDDGLDSFSDEAWNQNQVSEQKGAKS